MEDDGNLRLRIFPVRKHMNHTQWSCIVPSSLLYSHDHHIWLWEWYKHVNIFTMCWCHIHHLDMSMLSDSITPWWLTAVYHINPAFSMLVDGTWTKLKSQSKCEINVSQRWFLSFYVVLQTYVCLSTNFPSKCGFNLLFDAIKLGLNIMIDSSWRFLKLNWAHNDLIRRRWQNSYQVYLYLYSL